MTSFVLLLTCIRSTDEISFSFKNGNIIDKWMESAFRLLRLWAVGEGRVLCQAGSQGIQRDWAPMGCAGTLIHSVVSLEWLEPEDL